MDKGACAALNTHLVLRANFPRGGANFRMLTTDQRKTLIHISGMDIELERRGKGQPLLLLYGEEGLEPDAPFVDELAKGYEVFIPSPPGFGISERPDWLRNIDDISYVYLDLVEKLALKNVPVVGFSFGGWLAAEIAVKDDSFISKLALVAPYGIKVGGPSDRDVADFWTLPPSEVAKRKWHDPEKGKRDFPSMPEEKLTIVARNVETLARFCWEPFMHNPMLKRRLHRIKVPTRLIWGEHDGIVAPAYGKAYAEAIPGATLKVVPGAGHYPQLEQPEAFMAALREFLR
jgi:pimeloyl-ACP methyl ester carboxylesterase